MKAVASVLPLSMAMLAGCAGSRPVQAPAWQEVVIQQQPQQGYIYGKECASRPVLEQDQRYQLFGTASGLYALDYERKSIYFLQGKTWERVAGLPVAEEKKQ
jgi:hypothetical protein